MQTQVKKIEHRKEQRLHQAFPVRFQFVDEIDSRGPQSFVSKIKKFFQDKRLFSVACSILLARERSSS